MRSSDNDATWLNLVDYRRNETPFVDAFARFGIGLEERCVGLSFLYPRATLPPNHEDHFVRPLLQLWMEEAGQPLAVRRLNVSCYPWAAVEEAVVPAGNGTVHIRSTHVFQDERTLLSTFAFTSDGASGPLPFSWSGAVVADTPAHGYLKFYSGARGEPRTRFLDCAADGRSLWFGWADESGTNDLPPVGVLLSWDRDELHAERATHAFGHPAAEGSFYRLSGEPLALADGETVACSFRLTFTQASPRERLTRPATERPLVAATDFLPQARERFLARVNGDAAAPRSLPPSASAKLNEAKFHLLRNGFRGGNGRWKDRLGCLCSASRNFSVVFFWDTLFSSVALSYFDREYARDALETAFLDLDKRNGAAAESKFNFAPTQRNLLHLPQSPIATWALCEHLALHDDRALAERVYPVLTANHTYWQDYCDADRDGLSEYRWSGQAADNSPLWDNVAVDLKTGFNWIPPVASVALNSFLYKDALHLAEVATLLGNTEEAASWRQRADFLAQRLIEVCHVATDKRFWDYNQITAQHRKVKTFYLFWPLYADVPIPEDTRRSLIEDVLLDPRQFFGPVPFPSVAYDEPTYDPKGYWRGRCWPHISYWLVETLWKHGYQAEAHEATRRILARETETVGFTENLVSDPAIYDHDGFRGYNWGAAAAFLLHVRHFENAALPSAHEVTA